MRVAAKADVRPAATVVNAVISHRVEFLGRTDPDTVSIVMATRNTHLIVNGLKIDVGEAIALPPDHSIAAWSGDDAHVTLIFLPVRTLSTAGFLEPDNIRMLLAGETLHAENGSFTKVEGFLTNAASFMIMRRSVDFIEANLGDNLSITDLSRAAATSVSKLERTFRRVLDMSPSQYILARRLSSARRTLTSAHAESTSVASIALDNGFGHLGRFAAAYRRHFNELPRETLYQSAI
jgi:AraC-like DNA-binding protein